MKFSLDALFPPAKHDPGLGAGDRVNLFDIMDAVAAYSAVSHDKLKRIVVRLKCERRDVTVERVVGNRASRRKCHTFEVSAKDAADVVMFLDNEAGKYVRDLWHAAMVRRYA